MRGRIRRGHKVRDETNHGQRGNKFRQRQRRNRSKQELFSRIQTGQSNNIVAVKRRTPIVLRCTLRTALNTILDRRQLIVQTDTTKNRQPNAGHQRRHHHIAHNKLTNGSTARDLRNKNTNKRCPRDPPSPIKNGPAGEPTTLVLSSVVHIPKTSALKRLRVERQLENVIEVVTNALNEQVRQEECVQRKKHKKQAQEGEGKVELGETSNALVQAS
mmetsp:Transcript_44284/g.73247  ORF Transcript_44284/g.73247 Transcript_44284/m.73247 type:complete len:216 (+) Transcript_44284:473-1120(+)